MLSLLPLMRCSHVKSRIFAGTRSASVSSALVERVAEQRRPHSGRGPQRRGCVRRLGCRSCSEDSRTEPSASRRGCEPVSLLRVATRSTPMPVAARAWHRHVSCTRSRRPSALLTDSSRRCVPGRAQFRREESTRSVRAAKAIGSVRQSAHFVAGHGAHIDAGESGPERRGQSTLTGMDNRRPGQPLMRFSQDLAPTR